MTRHDALSLATQKFVTIDNNTPDEARSLALELLEWITNTHRTEFLTHLTAVLTGDEIAHLHQAIKEYTVDHKPIQYLLGSVPFLSATIRVRPPLLIPRPETEQWVDYCIKKLKLSSRPLCMLLDMCAGSGCVAVALAQAFPEATIYAVDSSAEAVALTQENAVLNGCSNIITYTSDLFTHLPDTLLFDCIVSNPPYVTETEWLNLDPHITQWEDRNALVADDNGLAIIKHIIQESPHRLTDTLSCSSEEIPQLLIEHADSQAPAVTHLMQESGFLSTTFLDLAGKKRFSIGRIPCLPT